MHTTICKLKQYYLFAGRRAILLGIVLLFQIIYIGPLDRVAYSWGAFRGIIGYKVTDTHQEILKAAYQLLMADPAMKNYKNLKFADGRGISIDEILNYEGVYGDIGSLSVSGPGPDADGASPYSSHWYNPLTKYGKAPESAAKQYYEFAKAMEGRSMDVETTIIGMTWSAHFMADMFVPYHLNGIPVFEATSMLNSGNSKLTEEKSGPLYLFNKTLSTQPPSGSLSDQVFQYGYGVNSDFKMAFTKYFLARGELQWGGPDNENNPVDWFDPWYWNGNVASTVFSSHATWEANAHTAWIASGGYNSLVFNLLPPYDKLWHNSRPDYEFTGTSGVSQSAQVYEFASNAALRTRNDLERIFLTPVEGIKQSVEAVYTLWRSALTALSPGVIAYYDPAYPGYLTIKCQLNNYSLEICTDLSLRFTIMKESSTLTHENITIKENLAPGQPIEIVRLIKLDPSQDWNILAEVVGQFNITPDLQYANGFFPYRPVDKDQIKTENVFGQNNWSPNSLTGSIYYLPEGTSRLPDFSGLYPAGYIYTKSLNVPERAFDSGFPGITNRFEWFALSYSGQINIPLAKTGEYTFKLISDDGSRLIIDKTIVINNDGTHSTAAAEGKIYLEPGIHTITIDYFQGPRLHVALMFLVKPPHWPDFQIFNMDDF